MKCTSCDVDLTHAPTLAGGDAYCCKGCREGGPCVCTYEELQPASARERGPAFLRELLDTYLEAGDHR